MALAVPTPLASNSHAKPQPLISRPSPNLASPSRPPSKVASGSTMPAKLSVKPLATPKPSSSKPAVVLAKDTSSSSGTVFAKPTKEWVIPDRAKPGRKVSEEEPDNKRQSQNRLSQRAHRARRTDYIATLEERIRQYEADEIHSNVRLQEVARALKADNERLKAELANSQSSPPEGEWEKLRRGMEEEIASLRGEILRLRGPAGAPVPTPRFWSSSNGTLAPAQPPTAARTKTRPTLDCPICPNPDPDCPCQRARASTSAPSLAPSPPRPGRTTVTAPPHEHEHEHEHKCGLCQSHEECLCTVTADDVEPVDVKPTLTISPPVKANAPLSPIAVMHDDSCGLCTSAEFCACKIASSSSSISPPRAKTVLASSVSIAAVPLRRGKKGNAPKSSIWALVDPSTKPAAREAVCTGDPSNCDACKNDSFGREFCAHLFAADAQKCARCSGKAKPPPSTSSTTAAALAKPQPHAHGHGHAHDDTMRPEQAWKALKAHPNAKLASLALLADVVARRTVTCESGSSEEGGDSPPLPANAEVPTSPSTKAINDALGDHHAAGAKGKRRVMVESGAVREALRMLDEAGVAGDEGVEGREAKRRKL